MHLFIYANVAIVKCIEFVWQVNLLGRYCLQVL